MHRKTAVTPSFAQLVSVTSVLATIACSASGSQPTTVELLARAPERGNWFPQTIEAKQGETVNLVIRNVDPVTHGFYLPGLNLAAGEIKAGDVRELTFTPHTAGEYSFYCSAWCSDFHMHMRGKLIVR
ncbi:MAG: cupredoxin domain-containing protein [Candidatus Eiseniibacteriota bacterium]|nr:MAG: cupredoxin domain-containing protein [Candidatus Eisenbacteria bacterium]